MKNFPKKLFILLLECWLLDTVVLSQRCGLSPIDMGLKLRKIFMPDSYPKTWNWNGQVAVWALTMLRVRSIILRRSSENGSATRRLIGFPMCTLVYNSVICWFAIVLCGNSICKFQYRQCNASPAVQHHDRSLFHASVSSSGTSKTLEPISLSRCACNSTWYRSVGYQQKAITLRDTMFVKTFGRSQVRGVPDEILGTCSGLSSLTRKTGRRVLSLLPALPFIIVHEPSSEWQDPRYPSLFLQVSL